MQVEPIVHTSVGESVLRIAGLIASMLLGALLAALAPMKGVGLVACIVVGSMLGALLWDRRTKPVGSVIVASVAIVVVGWPFVAVVLVWLHQFV